MADSHQLEQQSYEKRTILTWLAAERKLGRRGFADKYGDDLHSLGSLAASIQTGEKHSCGRLYLVDRLILELKTPLHDPCTNTTLPNNNIPARWNFARHSPADQATAKLVATRAFHRQSRIVLWTSISPELYSRVMVNSGLEDWFVAWNKSVEGVIHDESLHTMLANANKDDPQHRSQHPRLTLAHWMLSKDPKSAKYRDIYKELCVKNQNQLRIHYLQLDDRFSDIHYEAMVCLRECRSALSHAEGPKNSASKNAAVAAIESKFMELQATFTRSHDDLERYLHHANHEQHPQPGVTHGSTADLLREAVPAAVASEPCPLLYNLYYPAMWRVQREISALAREAAKKLEASLGPGPCIFKTHHWTESEGCDDAHRKKHDNLHPTVKLARDAQYAKVEQDLVHECNEIDGKWQSGLKNAWQGNLQLHKMNVPAGDIHAEVHALAEGIPHKVKETWWTEDGKASPAEVLHAKHIAPRVENNKAWTRNAVRPRQTDI